MQSLIASVYPILKDNYALDFAQIGMITLAFQFTASLLQPVVGHFTDKKAQPFSLAIGMGFTFFGLLLLSVAHHYGIILIAASLVGLGSAVFHPSRRGSRGLPPADATALRNRCSSSAAVSAPRWARCWRRWSWCRSASPRSPGFHRSPSGDRHPVRRIGAV
jgi:MFS family permease